MAGELDLKSAPWPSISAEAKELVARLLVRDPAKWVSSYIHAADIQSEHLLPSWWQQLSSA